MSRVTSALLSVSHVINESCYQCYRRVISESCYQCVVISESCYQCVVISESCYQCVVINNNNNNCLKSNIQCIEIRVQWTVHLGSSHMHVHAVTRVHAVTPKLVICVMYLTSI